MIDIKETVKAVKLVVGRTMIANRSSIYLHMIKAVDGQKIEWMNDSQLAREFSLHSHGSFELNLYRFMRKHREEFLSRENKLMSAFGAVKVFWISGGFSEAVIYQTDSGEKMLCCANWVDGPVRLEERLPSIQAIKKFQ
ncbi:MAG: hypothetical protein [Caudoviricetes sp.]|nr:MAG: hypothetical protein [Caudoviricetes sp.]